MSLARVLVGGLAVLAVGGTVASAEPGRGPIGPHKLRHSRTFFLAAGKTKTWHVSYRDALQYRNSRYSGSLTILRACRPRKPCPNFSRVHVLSRGSCEGGSDFCARVRNDNPAGTRAIGVRVTATTKLPPPGKTY